MRPVCGPCSRANRPDDCEYTDGQNRSRTQMLEDTIAQLETRIHELEHPNSAPTSVMLHDPHSNFYQTQQSPIAGRGELSSPLMLSSTEFSHGSHSSVSSSPPVGKSVTPSSDRYSDRIGTAVPATLSSTSVAWIASDEPPAHVVQELYVQL
jgi:hypothetical protein